MVGSVSEAEKASACRLAAKLPSSEVANVVLAKAETFRLFECQTLKTAVSQEVTKVLSDVANLDNIDDIFAAYMLNKRATLYGSSRLATFTAALEEHATKTWLTQFDADTWTFHRNGGKDTKYGGMKLQAAKMTEMLSFLMSSNLLKKDIEAVL